MGVGGDNGEGAGVEVSNTMSENGQFFFYFKPIQTIAPV